MKRASTSRLLALQVGESTRSALAKLAAAYGLVLACLGIRVKKGDSARLDGLHDVLVDFIRRVRTRGVIREVRSLVQYLRSAAERRARRNAAKDGRMARWEDLPAEVRPEEPFTDRSPARIAEVRDSARRAQEELDSLPTRQRKVIQLRVNGASHTEAARALGISPANARKAWSEGLETLRRKLRRAS